MDICLVCVVHDPEGRLVSGLRQAAPTLNRSYHEKYIAVSDETSRVVVSELLNAGFLVRMIPKKGAANARREALQFAQTSSCGHFHYCDLDRILTWTLYHPNELELVQETRVHDYTILGRTPRAFLSHPESWMKTEEITNRICSLALGQEVDVTAGSCAFNRKTLALLAECSSADATDIEWVMIVHRAAGGSIGYLEVDGLGYVEEINGPTTDQSNPKSWLDRLKLSCSISELVSFERLSSL